MMNTSETLQQVMATSESQLSTDTIVQIIIAIITLLAAVVACFQSHKANIKSDKANGLASEANRISKTTQALSMNLDLLDRRKDILERIQKCEHSKLSIEDFAPRIEKEQYDIVSADDIQILFLDDEHIKKTFIVFNECRKKVTKMCSDMNSFYELCEHNHPGALIWRTIRERYKDFVNDQNRDISTKEAETEFRDFCHEHIQRRYIDDEVVDEYDFLEIYENYEKFSDEFEKAKSDLCIKIRAFIKESIDPQKI